MTIINSGNTAPSITVEIYNDSGLPVTGLDNTTFPPCHYVIEGANAAVAITLAALAAETTTYSSGGVKERAGSAGRYRLDLPVAAVATAATRVKIFGEASGKHLVCEPIDVLPFVSSNLAVNATGVGTGAINPTSFATNTSLWLANQILIVSGTTSPNFNGNYVPSMLGGSPITNSKYAYGAPSGNCIWFDSATNNAWVLTTAQGVLGTNYWKSTGDETGPWINGGGTTTGSPVVTVLTRPSSGRNPTLATVDASGRTYSDLRSLLGTMLTETVTGYIAAAFKKLFDVASPVLTAASVNQSADNNAILSSLDARLTSARAGYLDNLNVGGVVASHVDVLAINTSTSKHLLLQTIGQFERPESSSVTYTVEARTFRQSDGAAINADSTPTLTAIGKVTGSLSGNLSVVTNPATGIYRWDYTVTSSAALEQLRFDVSVVISSSTYDLSCYTQVADFVSATWSTTDASHLTAIYNKLPSHNIADETNAASNASGILSAIGALPTAAAIWTYLTSSITTVGSIGLALKNFLSGYTAPPTSSEVANQVAETIFVDGIDNKLKVNSDHSANTTTTNEISVDISGIPPISVTVPAAVAAASQEPNLMTCLRGDTLRLSLPLMGNLVDRTKLVFTAKSSLNDSDADAVIQIIEGTGLVRLNGLAPVDSGTASVMVQNDSTGAVDLQIDATVTSILTIQDLVWDAQVHLPSSIVSPIAGTFSVVADVTRAVT